MQQDDDEDRYRPNVGVALFNAQGLVFVGERIDTPGAWQMPQGGVDEGEDIELAALRELEEETGIDSDNVKILRRMAEPVRYVLPQTLSGQLWRGEYKGQEQTWFAMRFTGQDGDIHLDKHEPEFLQWKWVPLEETISLIVPFKKDVYRAVIHAFSDLSSSD